MQKLSEDLVQSYNWYRSGIEWKNKWVYDPSIAETFQNGAWTFTQKLTLLSIRKWSWRIKWRSLSGDSPFKAKKYVFRLGRTLSYVDAVIRAA